MIKSKKHFCTDSLQNVGTTDVASSPDWIVAFFISLFINIVLISATLISRRYEIEYIFSNFERQTTVVFIFEFLFQKVLKLLQYLFLSFRYLSFSYRKTLLKQKSKTDKVIFSCRSGSIKDQTVTTGDSSHYQDLRVSKNENTYQSLHKH